MCVVKKDHYLDQGRQIGERERGETVTERNDRESETELVERNQSLIEARVVETIKQD